MTTVLSAMGIALGYGAVALLVARITYARTYRDYMNTAAINESTTEQSMQFLRSGARREARSTASLVSLAWPVTLPVLGLIVTVDKVCKRFVADAVGPTQAEKDWEQEQRRKTLQKDITRMEGELNRDSAHQGLQDDVRQYADGRGSEPWPPRTEMRYDR